MIEDDSDSESEASQEFPAAPVFVPLGGPITSITRANELAPAARPVAANVLMAVCHFLDISINRDGAYEGVSQHLHEALCAHFVRINMVPFRMPTRLQRALAFPAVCPELSGPKETLELMPMHQHQKLDEWRQLNALAHTVNPIEFGVVHQNQHDVAVQRVINSTTTLSDETRNLTFSAIGLGMQMRDSNRSRITSARMSEEKNDFDDTGVVGAYHLTGDIARMFYTARAVDNEHHHGGGPANRARAIMEVFEQMSLDINGNLEEIALFAQRLKASLTHYLPFLQALIRREELTDYNVLPTFNTDLAQAQDDYARASKRPKHK